MNLGARFRRCVFLSSRNPPHFAGGREFFKPLDCGSSSLSLIIASGFDPKRRSEAKNWFFPLPIKRGSIDSSNYSVAPPTLLHPHPTWSKEEKLSLPAQIEQYFIRNVHNLPTQSSSCPPNLDLASLADTKQQHPRQIRHSTFKLEKKETSMQNVLFPTLTKHTHTV